MVRLGTGAGASDALPRRAHGFATGGQCRAGANVVGIAFTSCIATIFKPLATGFLKSKSFNKD